MSAGARDRPPCSGGLAPMEATRLRGSRDGRRKPLPTILLGAGLTRATWHVLAVGGPAVLGGCQRTEARHRGPGSGGPVILHQRPPPAGANGPCLGGDGGAGA